MGNDRTVCPSDAESVLMEDFVPTASWVWSMPATNGDTFLVKPIRKFVDKYIALLPKDAVIIDPFARNCKIATITNDLNPETTADFHKDSVDFLKMFEGEPVSPSLVLFDPPYSPHQVKELYDSIGLKSVQQVGHRTASWKVERDIISSFQKSGDYVLSFNWNTVGMGKKRGYRKLEVLVVCHGACHNDTLCVAEVKL